MVATITAGKWGKGGKGKGTKIVQKISGGLDISTPVGEVRYVSAHHAAQAIQRLNGRPLNGSKLTIALAPGSRDKCRLIVQGIPSNAEWQELKDHFGQIGAVAFADVTGGGRKARTFCGHVRYEDPSVTLEALERYNGSELMGSQITVRLDPTSKDQTKLLVSGIPKAARWQELKDHFAQIGVPVAFCDIQKDSGAFEADGVEAELRYENPASAKAAVSMLDNSELEGYTIRVLMDGSSQDGTKLKVTGLNPTTSWQELKDHFGQCGGVAFAQVGIGKGSGGAIGVGGGFAGMGNMFKQMSKGSSRSSMGNMNMSNQMVVMPAALVQQMMSMLTMRHMTQMAKPKPFARKKF